VTVSDAFIRYQDVFKSFGSKEVLRGVDLDIGSGETVVVLGGSGTGKSVLLRHTVGLMAPLRAGTGRNERPGARPLHHPLCG